MRGDGLIPIAVAQRVADDWCQRTGAMHTPLLIGYKTRFFAADGAGILNTLS